MRNFETTMTRWPDRIELFAWARYKRGEMPTREEFDYIDNRARSKFPNAEFIELHRRFVVPSESNEVWWHFRWIDFSKRKGDSK